MTGPKTASWQCGQCGQVGIVELPAVEDVPSCVAVVREIHAKRSPECAAQNGTEFVLLELPPVAPVLVDVQLPSGVFPPGKDRGKRFSFTTRPLLMPPGPGWDRLNFQITVGWVGFYGTFIWDRLNKCFRLGLGVASFRVMWL